MKNSLLLCAVLITVTLWGCSGSGGEGGDSSEAVLRAHAEELAHKFIIVDTHVDIPYRLQEKMEDISVRTEGGDFDYPRARQGGLDAPFMSIYVPSSYQETGGARELADQLIDMVEKFSTDWPDKFALAPSVASVRDNFQKGVISLPMGMENGAPIEDLGTLKHFYDRGIRYITLAHATANQISDAAYDSNRKWGGLSPFGREVVLEMNRLGVMVDVSHITDESLSQVLEITQAPPIASHSSCRHFTPGWERNMSDEGIRMLAEKGGVIQIAWGSSFLSDEYRQRSSQRSDEIRRLQEEQGLDPESEEGKALEEAYESEHPIPRADVTDIVSHIDHVVGLVGIDHVGFGSDFDGVGDSLPTGMEDVSAYPNLIFELLKKGYTESDIEKICSGNLLRVWGEVERVAAGLQ